MAQTPQTLYRALIRTHHMTSRKKIAAITKAAKHQNCAVYIRTGKWRGTMIGECEEEDGLKRWVGDVKMGGFTSNETLTNSQRLRYKDYHLVTQGQVESGRLGVPFGSLREYESIKALAASLEECGVFEWWGRHMGFSKQDDGESD